MTRPISSGQMKRLQALYAQLCAHTDQANDRESRLIWAVGLVQRPLNSFRDLTQEDARHLIDTLQGQLGISSKTQERPRRRKRLSRDAAQRAGTEGRRDDASKTVTLATEADLARIDYALSELNWTRAQLDAWLRSTRSPLGHRANPETRTLRDANRVWWALKGMMDRNRKAEDGA